MCQFSPERRRVGVMEPLRESEGVNICCALFHVIDCADDEEHAHIGCEYE